MLDAIGIDADHSAVYRHLLTLPSASVDEVAAASGFELARVRSILESLESLGMLARQASAPDRVVASPPALALRPMLVDQQRRLARAHDALADLTELYRDGAAEREAPELVDVVLGVDAVRQRFGQLQAAAVAHVSAFVLSDIAFVGVGENVEEDRALARGVRYRAVVETKVLERPGFLEAARASAAIGEEVRVLPSLPTRLLIVDDRIALVPMRSRGDGREAGALLVHPSGLLDVVIAGFEATWAAATEFTSDSLDDAEGARMLGDGHDQVDRDLLHLLVLGLTDAAAARQLGISLRTAQRRIAQLMVTAGAGSRLQLGAAAARRGWV